MSIYYEPDKPVLRCKLCGSAWREYSISRTNYKASLHNKSPGSFLRCNRRKGIDRRIRCPGRNAGALRSQLGIVLQDTFLFLGIIMDNIRYGKLDATDEEVIAAAKAEWMIS